MTSTPRSQHDESLGESWVDLSYQVNSPRITPQPLSSGEEYLRLLKEAQRESNQSSARVSLASSRKDTPRESPKSPPNSPNTELSSESDEFRGVYINYSSSKEGESDKSIDWVGDWSSRPDQQPPKDWKFRHPVKKTYSIRTAKVGKTGLFSREVLYTLVLTNILSVLLGTGIGMWLSKRNLAFTSLALE